jgi:acetyl esterase
MTCYETKESPIHVNSTPPGVEVTLVCYDGMIHDYGFVNYLSQIPAVRSALHQTAEELKRHLK